MNTLLVLQAFYLTIHMGRLEKCSTVHGKTFEGENFHGFHGFSLICECFPMNHGLVDWQCKSTGMLA